MKAVSLGLVIIFLILTNSSFSLGTSFRQDARQTEEKIYERSEVDRPAKVKHRSEPRYTEQARRKRTSGWVVLRAVFKSNGEVGDIKVIRDLPDGLTEECIRATREIRFEPAVKDGNAVSQYVQVEYTFMIG